MSSCKVNFEQISYHILTRESRCLVKSVFMKDQVIMLIKLVSMEDQVVIVRLVSINDEVKLFG